MMTENRDSIVLPHNLILLALTEKETDESQEPGGPAEVSVF